jgi:hypothetical protein
MTSSEQKMQAADLQAQLDGLESVASALNAVAQRRRAQFTRLKNLEAVAEGVMHLQSPTAARPESITVPSPTRHAPEKRAIGDIEPLEEPIQWSLEEPRHWIDAKNRRTEDSSDSDTEGDTERDSVVTGGATCTREARRLAQQERWAAAEKAKRMGRRPVSALNSFCESRLLMLGPTMHQGWCFMWQYRLAVLLGLSALLLPSLEESMVAMMTEIARQCSPDVKTVWENSYHVVTIWDKGDRGDDGGPVWPIRLRLGPGQIAAQEPMRGEEIKFWYYFQGQWWFAPYRGGGGEVDRSTIYCSVCRNPVSCVGSEPGIAFLQALHWYMPLVEWFLEGLLSLSNGLLSSVSGLEFH